MIINLIPNSDRLPDPDNFVERKSHGEIHSAKAHDCVGDVKKKGHDEASAWAICTASMGKDKVYAKGHGGSATPKRKGQVEEAKRGCSDCPKSDCPMRGKMQEARLTAKQRAALPSSAFADPKNRRFPITDKAHARAALAYQRYAGPTVRKRIKAKAKKKGVGKARERAVFESFGSLFEQELGRRLHEVNHCHGTGTKGHPCDGASEHAAHMKALSDREAAAGNPHITDMEVNGKVYPIHAMGHYTTPYYFSPAHGGSVNHFPLLKQLKSHMKRYEAKKARQQARRAAMRVGSTNPYPNLTGWRD